MTYKLGDKIINNEFEIFCALNSVEGALKVHLAKIYRENGLDGLDVQLMLLGDENRLREDKAHLISNSKMEKAIIRSKDSTPDEVKTATRNRLSIAEVLFNRRNEREGD